MGSSPIASASLTRKSRATSAIPPLEKKPRNEICPKAWTEVSLRLEGIFFMKGNGIYQFHLVKEALRLLAGDAEERDVALLNAYIGAIRSSLEVLFAAEDEWVVRTK